MNNIFLCGYMGCGKTHVGQALALALNREVFDLDQEIVKIAKCSIPEIFKNHSEQTFRELEISTLSKLCEEHPFAVISTGGGIFGRLDNAAIMKKHGTTFYLLCSFETCYERIKEDNNRPLVISKTKNELKALYNDRHTVYLSHTDWAINANIENSMEDIILQIKEKLPSIEKCK